MAEKEIWKDITGYEDLYQISSFGRVKSLAKTDFNGKTKNSFIMSPDLNKKYASIGLYKKGRRKNHLVHRLVADSFVPGHFEGAVVNHKDEDKQNNRADNLEWCTILYNNTYGTRLARVSETKSVPVIGTSLYTGSKIYLKSAKEAEGLGFSSPHISSCITGKLKEHGGYKWKKVDTLAELDWIDKMLD